VSANVNADQLTVASGGTISVNGGITFTIDDGTGTDLTDSGTVATAGTITNNGQAQIDGTLQINEGGFPGGGTGTYAYNAATGVLVFNNSTGPYGVNNNNYWPTTAGPQNVTVQNTGGIQLNVARTVGGLFQYAKGVVGAGNLTLNGTSQVNAGGFTSGSPTYGSLSLLKYNTGGTYGRNGEWLPNATSGAGYPANVQLSGNTTLDLPNGSTTSPFQLNSNLTIDSGSTLNMGALTQPLTVLNAVTNNGTLNLSTVAGGDLHLQGGWIDTGTFNPNGRAVFFDGGLVQTLSRGGPGTESFDYLVINKSSNSLQLNNDVNVNATVGNVLQFIGTTTTPLDLATKTLTMAGNGGTLLVSGGARTVVSSFGPGNFTFTGSKLVNTSAGGTLAFAAAVNVNLAAGVNFAALATINGTLSVKAGGFVDTNAPQYAAGSTLQYDSGGSYDTAAEFPPTGVQNVALAITTQLNLNGNKTIGGGFAVGNRTLSTNDPGNFRSLTAGSITLGNGTLNLASLTAGSLTVTNSAAGGGQINLTGDWDVTTFTDNGSVASTVTFNGPGTKAVKKATTFRNVVMNQDVTALADVTVADSLALGDNVYTSSGTNTLTLNATTTFTRATGVVIGNLKKNFSAGSPTSFSFPVATDGNFAPVDASSVTGTGSLTVRTNDGKQPNIAGANALARYWTLAGTGITTDLTFHYLAADVVGTESNYQVLKYNAGFSTPPNQSVNTGAHTATVNSVNSFSDWTLAEPASVFGQLQFSAANYDTPEGNSGTHNVTVNVARTGGASGAISVHYATTAGTATAGSDYTTTSGDLNWADGDSADKTFTVSVTGDTNVEPDETINLTLSAPTGGAVLGSPSTATITIQNDDVQLPTLAIDDVTHMEGNAGTTAYTFTVTKTGTTASNTTVDFATANGTTNPATGGAACGGSVDYVSNSNTLTFLPAETTKQITVNVCGDPFVEPDETFFVNLSNPTNATITDNQGLGTIQNDDTPPNTVYVDDDFTGPVGSDPDGAGGPATAIGYDAFPTIQGGIDGVAANGTVNVAAGNYAEQPIIGKSLTLQGAGAGTTNISAPNTLAPRFSNFFILVEVNNGAVVEASGITVKGPLNLNGCPGTTAASRRYYGVYVRGGAALNLHDSSVLDIRENNPAGNTRCLFGTAVDVGSTVVAPNQIGTLTLDHTTITGFQARAVTVDKTGSTATITNNTLTGSTSPATTQTVILVAVGASANISGNQISGAQCSDAVNCGPDTFNQFAATGISLTAPANGTQVTNNTISNNDYGINYIAAPGVTANISGNTFNANRYFGINNSEGNLTVSNNTFSGASNVAVAAISVNDPQNQTASNSSVTFTGNTITGATVGLQLLDQPGFPADSFFPQLTAHFNRIVATTAIDNPQNNTSNMENNWWGCNAGPGNTGCGAVTGTGADFDPWFVLAASATPNAIAPGGSSNVAADITRNSDNVVPASAPPDMPVSFSATNGTMNPTSATLTAGAASSTFTSTNASNAVASATVDNQNANAPITINLPTFTIDDVTHMEGNSSTTAYVFTVTKTGAGAASVDFTTVDGTATTANNDYTPNTGTLNFAASDTTKTITVLVNGDATVEPDETFTVHLSNALNASISDADGTGTIQNDDGAPSVVYVDDDFTGAPGTDPDGAGGPATSIGFDAFQTIQGGVNGVAPGGTVYVAAGTYAENVTVNKSLSLLGPNANIDPNTGTRATEAFVIPAVTETSLQSSTTGTIFRVGTASGHVNVTIKGLTIDGHNPALTGGRTINGVEINTGAGIVNSIDSFDSNPNAFDATMIVQNNIIQNLERYGVLADNVPARTPAAGTDVSHNKIDNLPSGNNFGGGRGRAIAFEENLYGSATYNVITRVNVGWQDDNYNSASPGAATLVSHNTIHTYHRGIFHNLQYQDASNATISDNDIFVETPGDFPASATNFGLELASIQSGVGATVTNNNVTGNVYGILLWNLPTTADITVSGGTLTGNSYGVYATSTDPQFGSVSAHSHSIVSGVTITGSTVTGVYVDDGNSLALHQNSIFANAGLGIDLGGDGVTANDDKDTDTGANNLQNFPVISSATVTGSTRNITGTLNSVPGQTFSLEFYKNDTCDAAGNGEGKTYIGSLATGPTDTDGNVSFSFHPATLNTGDIITATATDANGNTSEFSQCVTGAGGSAGAIEFTMSSYTVNEGSGTASIDVTRLGGSDGSISATFSTADDTAHAPADYTAVTNQTITYADGETGTKTVNVSIVNDGFYEGDETVNLSLSTTSINRPSPNITSGRFAVLTIQDNDTKPTLAINDVHVAEPASGTTQAVFTVTLTGTAQDPVTVHYQMNDGTATAPDDYTAISDTVLTFAPGETTKPVSVTINADALSEPAETFTVDLSNPSANATIADGQGVGTITDQVQAGQLLISEFRLRGAAGSNDEFIELYNNTNTPLTVATNDGSAGWAVASSDNPTTPLIVIPAGTVIPARGHYLIAREPAGGTERPNVGQQGQGYSLSAYASPDQTYVGDIPDNAGVAVFQTADASALTTAQPLDAVGFAAVSDTRFREGAGLLPVTGITDAAEHSFVRNLSTGIPIDTQNNADDFVLVAPDPALVTTATAQLGAPGPENDAAPTQHNAPIKSSLIEPQQVSTAPPNRVRDLTPVANGAQGTLSLRRRFTNTTGQTVTRLRFRIVDVTTLNTPNPGGAQADVRLLDSPTFNIMTSRGPLTVHGTFVETPPAQTNGGGLNASAGIVGLPVGLVPGSSIDVQFLLGVQANGRFRFLVNVEALP
jgi:hypothetical protein